MSPLLKDEKHSAYHEPKAREVVSFQRLLQIQDGKNTKPDQGNHFLDGFQLRGGEFPALMIYERFYCNHGYTAAPDGLAAQLVNVLQ